MLATLEHNARELGLDVETAACDASELPFEDETFDLVLGHAVLHHLPDLDQAFREFNRVLKPGGTLFFAGEPSRQGDKLAAYPKRAAVKAAPLWRKAMKARPAPQHHGADEDEHALEAVVDVHAFVPSDLTQARHRGRLPGHRGPRRGAAGELVRLVQPHVGGERRAQGRPVGLDPVRLQGLHLAPARGPQPPGAPPAAADLLQPDARGPQAGVSPPEQHPPGPFDMLRDKRAMVDTTVAPIAFVIVYTITKEVNVAAAVAVGIGIALFVERLVRRKPVINAIGGLFAIALAAFIAVRSGNAEGFFWPKVAQQGGLFVIFAGSVVVRRPLTGFIVAQLYRADPEWQKIPAVRRVMSEYTLIWASLFLLRAVVFLVGILAGKVGFLGVAVLVMGLPAFGVLLFFGYRWVPKRLEQLGAPDPRHPKPEPTP